MWKFATLWLVAAGVWGADAPFPVPANLRADGIPPLPATLMEKLARYNESRSAILLDWHPTRREILISTRFGDVPQIHRVAMPGGARTQLTFYADRVAGARYEPVTGRSFIYAKDVGGGEFYQLYRAVPESAEVTLLTDGKSRNTGARWSRDGSRLAYSSTRRNGRDTDLYVLDPNNPESNRLLLQVEGGGWQAENWSPDGRKLLVQQYRSVSDTALYIVDADTGAKEQLTPAGEKASYSSPVFSADGKGIYLTTNRGAEFQRLAYLNLDSNQFSFLRPELQWDVEDLALSRDGRRLAYTVNEDGSSALRVLETGTMRELVLPHLAYGVIGDLRWHANGRDLGFTLSSARSPADVYSVDVDKGTLERWTRSETGGLNADTFSEPELVRWKSFDGRTISGFLYRPPERFTGRRPLIINIHGGPEGQARPFYMGRINYYLNELGVAILYPNVRGSTGYGKTFVDLDNGYRREDSVKDIGSLLDWVATQPGLDASRVMVTGGSYGGYMTLASAFHYNDRVRCTVDVVGISNFVTFFERTEAYRRDLRRVEYGDERDPKMREFLLQIAPLHNASKITKPMLIVAGKNDPRVPWQEGEQMAAAIRNNGAPVWYLVAADEGHGFAKKRNQDIQFAATVLFVQEFLLR